MRLLRTLFFSDRKDYTSVNTSLLHFEDNPNLKFSLNIAILARNHNGNLCRLIHQKGWIDSFLWNEVPHSHNIKEKVAALKIPGLWNNIRDTYMNKKNMYLRRNDQTHP